MNGGWDLRHRDLTMAIRVHTSTITSENAELLSLVAVCNEHATAVTRILANLPGSGQTLGLQELEGVAQGVADVRMRMEQMKKKHQWPFNGMLHDYIKVHYTDIEFEQKRLQRDVRLLEKALPNCTPDISQKYERTTQLREELKVVKRGFAEMNELYKVRNEQVVRNERVCDVIFDSVEESVGNTEFALAKIYQIMKR